MSERIFGDMTLLLPIPISTDEAFERLFAVFPTKRRGTRRLAYPAWKKAIKREAPEVILAGAVAYAESEPGEYAKGLPSWLNGDCWAIEYAPSTQKKQRSHSEEILYKQLKKEYAKPYHGFMDSEKVKWLQNYERELMK